MKEYKKGVSKEGKKGEKVRRPKAGPPGSPWVAGYLDWRDL